MWIISWTKWIERLLLFARSLRLAGRLGRGQNLCGGFLELLKGRFGGSHGRNYTKMQGGLQ